MINKSEHIFAKPLSHLTWHSYASSLAIEKKPAPDNIYHYYTMVYHQVMNVHYKCLRCSVVLFSMPPVIQYCEGALPYMNKQFFI